jgi:hypothetical protein
MTCIRLLVLSLVVAALAACPKPLDNGDGKDKPDAGPSVITCDDESDCPANQPTCQFGVCVKECAANAGCDEVPGTFCDPASHVCAPGCRTSAECGGGQVCTVGACVDGAGCGSKCDCEVGQVCNAGQCDDPPAQCTNADDCGRGAGADDASCNAYSCDGFSFTCVDLSPDPCTNADDCFGRLGCEDGCLCTPSQQCVPDAACTIATERDDCGIGFYCNNDLRCAAIPVCTQDTDCDEFSLTCDEGSGKCTRPQSCTATADCAGFPPTTYCDTRVAPSFCAVPNCINGGQTCNAGTQECSADGRCVPIGTGDPCTNDSACPADQYCASNGACAPGCRNDSTCPPNQSCNSAHTCVGALQGLNGPCGGDEECQVGLVCYQNTCQESCDAYDIASCDNQPCCTLTAKPCCNFFHVCTDGTDGTFDGCFEL